MPRQIDETELPASFRDETHAFLLPATDPGAFIEQDLSIGHINDILPRLWLAGRPYPPRSLSIQGVLKRTTVPTNDASLHLVWASGKIYIKPLPRYVLSDSFYDQYLRQDKPHELALGFVFTYLALIPSELDFALARKDHLVPSDFEWLKWKGLVSRVLLDYPHDKIYGHIHRRYVYGELRHDRLDKIYRYLHGSILHGFSPLMGANDYGEFVAEHLGPITAATVYIILVLTAMQVVLTAGDLGEAWYRPSYNFAIFAIAAPGIALGFILGILVFMLTANLIKTLQVKRGRMKKIGIPDEPRLVRSYGVTNRDTVDLVHLTSVPQQYD